MADPQQRPEPGENPPAWADAVYDAVKANRGEQDEEE